MLGRVRRNDLNHAEKLKWLEDENRRLKHLVADVSPGQEVLKTFIQRGETNGWSGRSPANGRPKRTQGLRPAGDG
jgi:hypothetical protein